MHVIGAEQHDAGLPELLQQRQQLCSWTSVGAGNGMALKCARCQLDLTVTARQSWGRANGTKTKDHLYPAAALQHQRSVRGVSSPALPRPHAGTAGERLTSIHSSRCRKDGTLNQHSGCRRQHSWALPCRLMSAAAPAECSSNLFSRVLKLTSQKRWVMLQDTVIFGMWFAQAKLRKSTSEHAKRSCTLHCVMHIAPDMSASRISRCIRPQYFLSQKSQSRHIGSLAPPARRPAAQRQ